MTTDWRAHIDALCKDARSAGDGLRRRLFAMWAGGASLELAQETGGAPVCAFLPSEPDLIAHWRSGVALQQRLALAARVSHHRESMRRPVATFVAASLPREED